MSTPAIFNLVISVIGVITWAAYWKKFPYKWGYAIWALVYLFNVIMFYLASGFDLLTPVQLNTWSSAIRIYVGIFCIVIPLSIIHFRGPLPWISPQS